MTKVCTKCKLEKPFDAFTKQHKGKFGLRGRCKVCRSFDGKNHYQKNIDRYRTQHRLYNKRNPDKIKTASIKWAKEHPERTKEIQGKYRKVNKQLCLENGRRWRQRNKAYVNAKKSARLKRVQLATPIWAKKGIVMRAIREIYKSRPFGYHVDHIIPLRGEHVSGLHVPWNLQYLPAIENIKKQNKVIITEV